ncbi:hypothetical protein C4K03_3076 [Pseudomonas synxantha]|uniref:Uncharacterized protein n=1 Tax=Pseudomonas synxantha TaxID=47883 RepID=A0A3G7U7N9_9PSED|nr:hypothetical protein C4K03_3076 [Pseudomonas synxantha]
MEGDLRIRRLSAPRLLCFGQSIEQLPLKSLKYLLGLLHLHELQHSGAVWLATSRRARRAM